MLVHTGKYITVEVDSLVFECTAEYPGKCTISFYNDTINLPSNKEDAQKFIEDFTKCFDIDLSDDEQDNVTTTKSITIKTVWNLVFYRTKNNCVLKNTKHPHQEIILNPLNKKNFTKAYLRCINEDLGYREKVVE